MEGVHVANEDRTKGKLKKGAGKLTGDDQMEAEGRQQEKKGEMKEKWEDTKRTVSGSAKNVRDSVTGNDDR
jgi:uncharacterized protein YjbJ (UPF0337 family)